MGKKGKEIEELKGEIKYASEILSIVKHGLEGNKKGVRAYAELMYQKIQHDDLGDTTFANALSSFLSGKYKEKPPIRTLKQLSNSIEIEEVMMELNCLVIKNSSISGYKEYYNDAIRDIKKFLKQKLTNKKR